MEIGHGQIVRTVVPPPSQRKYLVLGSTGYVDVDAAEWDVAELPNFRDYHVVIVDVRSLDKERLKTVSNARLEELRKALVLFLDSKGELIVLTDRIHRHKRPKHDPELVDNYDWCPVYPGLSTESGDTVEVISEDEFPRYLAGLKKWPYYFSFDSRWMSNALVKFYGYEMKYDIPCKPIIKNRYGKVIAGTYHITARRGGEDHLFVETGEITFLPLIESLSLKEAVTLVLEDLIGVSQKVAPPHWVESVQMPLVPEMDRRLADQRQQLADIQSKIEQLEGRKATIHEYRRLLFSSGKDLEEIVEKCFNKLGGSTKPAEYAEEEFVLEFDNEVCLVEVKGNTKSISLTDLRQVSDYVLKYEHDTGNAGKGILFGNAWRTLPPEERNKKDRLEFPSNVEKRANQYDISLVSSTKFFKVFCDFLEDKSKGQEILRKIVGGSGVIEF